MANIKWSKEEVIILRETYPFYHMDKLLMVIKGKTKSQIRSKAKLLKIKKEIKPLTRQGQDLKSITRECTNCKVVYMNKQLSKFCNECKKINGQINNYKIRYGIQLNFNTFLNGYNIIQWYRWTNLEKTPNGKFLCQIPTIFITEKFVGIITRYVINDILNYRTREKVLTFSQKDMNKYKIGFSKTPFVLNSPMSLLRLAFPELDIQNWELKHAGNGVWANYDIFLQAVHHYYFNILSAEDKIEIDVAFSDSNVTSLFCKLQRAKELHYYDVEWEHILRDVGVIKKFKNRAFSYDGTKMGSFEEAIIYNFIHNEMGIKDLKSIGFKKEGKYIFNVRLEDNEDKFYAPDFVIEKVEEIIFKKPIIIEYYGLLSPSNENKMLKMYKEKVKRKNKYYNESENIIFVDIYPRDLKKRMVSIRDKINNAISCAM
jgi:hypothetical protein